ncbi:MAG: helix-turn-helix transcriptional regulator [Candidatus Berkelbacteria bacterium]
MLKLITKLKVFRAMDGLTQQQLADKVGVSRNTINSLEKGEFSPSFLLVWKLAELFKVKTEEIVYYEEQ